MKTFLGRDRYDWAGWALSSLLIMSVAALVYSVMASCDVAHAAGEEWNVENVYRAIVTESIGEGVYVGHDGKKHLDIKVSRKAMEYVASCFWNRRNHVLDLGSVGAGRSDFQEFEGKQPARLLECAHQLAARVVDGEGSFDVVRGATQFESLDFPRPTWVKDGEFMEVFRYKKHVFYSKVQR